MYIEFTLPTGAGGMAAAQANALLNNELQAWSKQYGVPFNTKVFKYTKRVTFDNEDLYSFFAMTWNPKNKKYKKQLSKFNLIEPMRRPV